MSVQHLQPSKWSSAGSCMRAALWEDSGTTSSGLSSPVQCLRFQTNACSSTAQQDGGPWAVPRFSSTVLRSGIFWALPACVHQPCTYWVGVQLCTAYRWKPTVGTEIYIQEHRLSFSFLLFPFLSTFLPPIPMAPIPPHPPSPFLGTAGTEHTGMQHGPSMQLSAGQCHRAALGPRGPWGAVGCSD